MLEVLGTIGSLAVVLILIVLATLVISVIVLITLAALAGSMANWGRLWRRLTRRDARLTLKLSGNAVPERRRGDLSGATPRLRRHFRLGGARGLEGRREHGRLRQDPREPGRRGHRPVERHLKL